MVTGALRASGLARLQRRDAGELPRLQHATQEPGLLLANPGQESKPPGPCRKHFLQEESIHLSGDLLTLDGRSLVSTCCSHSTCLPLPMLECPAERTGQEASNGLGHEKPRDHMRTSDGCGGARTPRNHRLDFQAAVPTPGEAGMGGTGHADAARAAPPRAKGQGQGLAGALLGDALREGPQPRAAAQLEVRQAAVLLREALPLQPAAGCVARVQRLSGRYTPDHERRPEQRRSEGVPEELASSDPPLPSPVSRELELGIGSQEPPGLLFQLLLVPSLIGQAEPAMEQQPGLGL
mmetsp:Transcript_114610/g.370316  ORF Transcript_114610/g.370316 Transcript_114610/m.370316 type:complete len:294 (-) Transcript_114610:1482-2363(-)